MVPKPSRHERRKLQTRQRLLDAAKRVIASHGYEDTGVLDITEEADVSKGTFYQHFKDKEDLTRALILEGFEELNERIEKARAGKPHVLYAREILRVIFRYAAENRDMFHIMLGGMASAELRTLAYEYYAKSIEEALALDGITAENIPFPPAMLARFIAGAGVSLALWWLEDDHGLSPEQMAEFTYRLFRDGALNVLPLGLQPPEDESETP